MSLKDTIASDIERVFLNNLEFSEKKNVWYDGILYEKVSVVLAGLDEEKRQTKGSDHASGLYRTDAVAFIKLGTIGDAQPEVGTKILFGEPCGSGIYYRSFYVASSDEQMGMVRLELEAIDE